MENEVNGKDLVNCVEELCRQMNSLNARMDRLEQMMAAQQTAQSRQAVQPQQTVQPRQAVQPQQTVQSQQTVQPRQMVQPQQTVQPGQAAAQQYGTPQPQVQYIRPQPQVSTGAAPARPQTGERGTAERTIGKNVMAILAAVFVFLGLAFLAVFIIPNISSRAFVGIMYTLSGALTISGCILTMKHRENYGFLAMAACGFGAVYIATIVSNFALGVFGTMSMCIGITVWAVGVSVMSRLRRSWLFVLIGQAGVYIVLMVGMISCADFMLRLDYIRIVICYAIAMITLFAANIDRDYTKNRINLIALLAGLATLTVSFNKTVGTLENKEIIIYGLCYTVLALIPTVLGFVWFETEKHAALEFGFYTLGFVLVAIFNVARPVEGGVYVALLVFGLLTVAACELKMPGRKPAGYIILMAASLTMVLIGCEGIVFTSDSYLIGVLALIALLIGLYKGNAMYMMAAMAYAIAFVPFSFYPDKPDYLHFFMSIGVIAIASILVIVFKKRDNRFVKLGLHLLTLVLMGLGVYDMFIDGNEFFMSRNMLGAVIVTAVLGLINLIPLKLRPVRFNRVTGREELVLAVSAYVINALLMLEGLIILCNCDENRERIFAAVLCVLLFAVNSFGELFRRKTPGVQLYLELKLLVLLIFILYAFDVPGIFVSVAGIAYAVLAIIAGFMLLKLKQMNTRITRMTGLIIVIIGLMKLLVVDISYDNMLYRALSFFVAGALCFGISFLYGRIDRKYGKEVNTSANEA